MTAVKDQPAETTEPAIDYNAVQQRLSVQPAFLAYISERRILREDANRSAVTTMTARKELPVTVTSVRMMEVPGDVNAPPATTVPGTERYALPNRERMGQRATCA